MMRAARSHEADPSVFFFLRRRRRWHCASQHLTSRESV